MKCNVTEYCAVVVVATEAIHFITCQIVLSLLSIVLFLVRGHLLFVDPFFQLCPWMLF